MIQFTLGCVLIALSLFFGGKEIWANKDITANRSQSLQSQESRVKRSQNIRDKFEDEKENTIMFSTEIKNNILNQLNIDERKYDFKVETPEQNNKALTPYKYTVQGYDNYGDIFSLIGDSEKIKGLFVNDICMNCKIKTKKHKKDDREISFKIEGIAYVYNQK